MNFKILTIRMIENYDRIKLNKTEIKQLGEALDTRISKSRMTLREHLWAEEFERLQYSIERGHDKFALDIAKQLKGEELTREQKQSIIEETRTKQRCNYAQASAWLKGKAKSRKSQRAAPETLYDAADWVRQMLSLNQETGEEYEIASTTSPEDALIAAIDRASSKGTDLDGLMMLKDAGIRKAGRPKKEDQT